MMAMAGVLPVAAKAIGVCVAPKACPDDAEDQGRHALASG